MTDHAENTNTPLTAPPVGGTIQVGSIVAYYGTTAPDTWLFCDGSRIPVKYGTLINLVGIFTPNLSGRVPLGVGNGNDGTDKQTFALGNSGGKYRHTLQLTEIPSHQHFGFGESSDSDWGTGRTTSKGYIGTGDNDYDNYLYGSTFTGGNVNDKIDTNNESVTGRSQGSTSPHNNTQPYLAVNYIIYAGTN